MTQLFWFLVFTGAYLLGSHAWSSDCAQLFHETGKTSPDLVQRENEYREFRELVAKLRFSEDEINALTRPGTGMFRRPIGDFSNEIPHTLLNVLLRKISHHVGDRKSRIKQIRFWVEDLVAYQEDRWDLGRWLALLDPKNKVKYDELYLQFTQSGWIIKPLVFPESETRKELFRLDPDSKVGFVNLAYLEDIPPFLVAIEVMQRAMMSDLSTMLILFPQKTFSMLDWRLREVMGEEFSEEAARNYLGYYTESALAGERARVYQEMREISPEWRSKHRESPLRINDDHAGELIGITEAEREGVDDHVIRQVGRTFSEFLFRNPVVERQ